MKDQLEIPDRGELCTFARRRYDAVLLVNRLLKAAPLGRSVDVHTVEAGHRKRGYSTRAVEMYPTEQIANIAQRTKDITPYDSFRVDKVYFNKENDEYSVEQHKAMRDKRYVLAGYYVRHKYSTRYMDSLAEAFKEKPASEWFYVSHGG